MQDWTATTRHGVTRKRSTKRLKHTGNLFTKNLQWCFLCGVLQGSTLGPLPFLFYVSDLANSLEKSIVHHFADNTKQLYDNKNFSVISDVINSELKLVTD